MALSARLKPSADPGNKEGKKPCFGVCKVLMPHARWSCYSPIAIDVHCLFCSAARSSTQPLASYPVTEHNSNGVDDLTCWDGNFHQNLISYYHEQTLKILTISITMSEHFDLHGRWREEAEVNFRVQTTQSRKFPWDFLFISLRPSFRYKPRFQQQMLSPVLARHHA